MAIPSYLCEKRHIVKLLRGGGGGKFALQKKKKLVETTDVVVSSVPVSPTSQLLTYTMAQQLGATGM